MVNVVARPLTGNDQINYPMGKIRLTIEGNLKIFVNLPSSHDRAQWTFREQTPTRINKRKARNNTSLRIIR
jgi:hypothetical protein